MIKTDRVSGRLLRSDLLRRPQRSHQRHGDITSMQEWIHLHLIITVQLIMICMYIR